MNRRKFLETTGVAVGASMAGCLRAVLPSVGLDETVKSRFGEFSIDTVTAQQSVVTRDGAGSTPHVENDQEQYLLVFGGNFADEYDDDDRSGLKSEFDIQLRGSNSALVPIVERRVGTNATELSEDFYLMFRFPRDRTGFGQTTLRYRGQNQTHSWDLPEILPDSVLAYVADPPEFEVTAVELPGRAETDTVTAAVTVAERADPDRDEPEPFNITLGSTATRERGAYGIPVAGGETVTESFDITLTRASGEIETVRLGWGYEERTRNVTID